MATGARSVGADRKTREGKVVRIRGSLVWVTRSYVGTVDDNLDVVIAAMEEGGLIKRDIVYRAGGIPAHWGRKA